jgi:hypothetical protein
MTPSLLKALSASSEPLLTRPDLSLRDYQLAIAWEGPLAWDWQDKPHRLIYDLCLEIQRLREELVMEKRP